MLLYLFCDRCRAPSTRIIYPGWPGREAVYCARCYAATLKPIAGGAESDDSTGETADPHAG
jgi:hypothetical protein